jgi:hypothetical protein
MPLHSGRDRMAVVLLTLSHLENMTTASAIAKYREGLGGDACVDFLTTKQSAYAKEPKSAKGQFYKALELFEILKVESVFGGLYKP